MRLSARAIRRVLEVDDVDRFRALGGLDPDLECRRRVAGADDAFLQLLRPTLGRGLLFERLVARAIARRRTNDLGRRV